MKVKSTQFATNMELVANETASTKTSKPDSGFQPEAMAKAVAMIQEAFPSLDSDEIQLCETALKEDIAAMKAIGEEEAMESGADDTGSVGKDLAAKAAVEQLISSTISGVAVDDPEKGTRLINSIWIYK